MIVETSSERSQRKPYRKPGLVVYGRLEELTLTEFFSSPMNDKGSADTKTA